MKQAFKISALLLAPLLASGCTVIPGSHFSSSHGTLVDQYQEQGDDLSYLIDIYPITPSLVNNLAPQPNSLPSGDAELRAQVADYDYRVGAGDVLSVTVWDHPELTTPAGQYRSSAEAGSWVHNDGTIFYPYVGRLKVEGLNVTEIRTLITRELGKYIENPQVDVTIAAFRSKWVYVTGEVGQPGTQPITNIPLTLLDAVSQAGGLTEHADWQNVTLTRNGDKHEFSLRELYKKGNVSQNILLQPNDVVHISRNDDGKIFVLGEVGKQQTLAMGRNGKTLAEALGDSSGMNQITANTTGIFVFRRAPEASGRLADVYQLDAKNAAALVLADGFALQERDIVYVTAAPITRWNRVLAQLLPTVTGIYSVTRTADELGAL